MKKNFLFLMTFMLISMVIGFTSCSSDGEELEISDLPTPLYENVSGKYVVNNNSSNYESIELTSSGNYIITLKSPSYRTTVSGLSVSNKTRVFTHVKPQTRSNQDGLYIYGTYTQVGEDTFDLEGFGKLMLEYTGEQVVGIEITTSNSKVTVQVTKEPTMADNKMTNALCRTWELEKNVYEETDKTTGETESRTLTPENPGMDERDFPKTVIYTKSGTYCVTYLDGSIGIARWRWKDVKAGIVEYIWDGEWGYSGTCRLTFRGNELEVYEEMNDEYEYSKYWYYLKAAEANMDKPETGIPEKEGHLKNVFTGKLLKEVDGKQMTYENGYLKSIKGNDFNMTFTYNYATQTPGSDVYAVIKASNYTIEFEITLNQQGFAESIKEIHTDRHDVSSYYKTLKYDNDGHLIALDDGRTGRNHTIQWQNDCLFISRWGNGDWAEMNLTNMPNTNCMMFYYYVNGIDMDEVQYLYWAGLLGKSSKTLPDYRVEEDSNGNKEITQFTWTDHSLTYKSDSGSHDTIYFSFYE